MNNKKGNNNRIPDLGDIPAFPGVELDLSDWRDGIVVRSPNWLGDAVMCIPAMMQVRDIIPEGCGFFVVCPPSLRDLFSALPFVDVILTLHAPHSLWKMDEIHKLRMLHAGIGILFNNSLRDTIFFKLAGVRKLFGASARGRDVLLRQSFKFPEIRKGELNNLHHAGRYLSMAYALGADKWTGNLPELNIPKEPELMSRELLDFSKEEKILAVAPGAAYGKSKQWPVENFIKVCSHWISENGKVALLGTEKDSDISENVCSSLAEGSVINLAGRTDLAELMFILKRAEMCIANDSGTMHLSALLGGKGIAIFGSTDPGASSPVSNKWTVLYEKQDCAPCFKRECRFGSYECLKKITAERAIKTIEELEKEEKIICPQRRKDAERDEE